MKSHPHPLIVNLRIDTRVLQLYRELERGYRTLGYRQAQARMSAHIGQTKRALAKDIWLTERLLGRAHSLKIQRMVPYKWRMEMERSPNE